VAQATLAIPQPNQLKSEPTTVPSNGAPGSAGGSSSAAAAAAGGLSLRKRGGVQLRDAGLESASVAAYALGNLAACNAENCLSIAKEGGIAVFVHLVQAGAQDAQKDAVKTLGNLGLHNAGNSAEIALVGGHSSNHQPPEQGCARGTEICCCSFGEACLPTVHQALPMVVVQQRQRQRQRQ
jgi:hypothetical protein